MELIKKTITQKPYLWFARDLMEQLDYKNWSSFSKLIDDAVKTMILLEIPYYKNVFPTALEESGKSIIDFKLTRFACYLVVMSADIKKTKVIEEQNRFMIKAEQYGIRFQDVFELKRLQIRDNLAEASKDLSRKAAKGNVNNFSSFNDSGYLGLYKMNSQELHDHRKLPKNIGHQECMGHTEIAANLLRITLTSHEIWMRKISGQKSLEFVHHQVGFGIRELIKKHTDKYPEEFPVYQKLSELKEHFKAGYLRMVDSEN